MLVLLDSSVIGLITNPRASASSEACSAWIEGLLVQGHDFAIPEIVDYELRRELLRMNKTTSIAQLDLLQTTFHYLRITTRVMRQAAIFWADARKAGAGGAPDNTIDCDMILAAQAHIAGAERHDIPIVATENVRHLRRFVEARVWRDI